MKLDNKKTYIILAVLIALSLAISTFYMGIKQGYHEDELLTYNLANSTECLSTDGTDWNTPEDFNSYLSVSESDRFNYAQVYENQIIDASHPPFYYALVHTVCSLFPNQFSRWFAYSINVLAITGVLILLFKIGKRISRNNLYALIGTAAYALSIACITTTIYLRMYATLSFFVLSFIYLIMKMNDSKGSVKIKDSLLLGVVVLLGTLTQYYFIMFEGLTGLVYLVFKIKERHIKDLFKAIIPCAIASALALCIYPYIISNVLGGNRGLGSLDISVQIDTIITYVIYKLGTYIQVLSKDMFLNLPVLFAFCAVCAVGFGIYFRFFKKRKLSQNAVLAAFPAVVYFIVISLLSPFNSDRYVMASLPLIAMLFAFTFISIFGLFRNEKLTLAVPAGMLVAFAIAFATVTPYYIYGKTNLYDRKTDSCVFVGTSMLEWNKCIDKLENYDSTLIVQSADFNPDLADELESFATSRGVVTHGMIMEFANGYMYNGETNKEDADSLSRLVNNKELDSKDSITVYISRLADKEKVMKFITDNTKFKHNELIQADYSFDEFYNWYDYFVETESYCNVYRFYQ